MEWDTAAGHAVLEAAGGRVLQPDGAPFVYGKGAKGFANGPFVAWGREPALAFPLHLFAPRLLGFGRCLEREGAGANRTRRRVAVHRHA